MKDSLGPFDANRNRPSVSVVVKFIGKSLEELIAAIFSGGSNLVKRSSGKISFYIFSCKCFYFTIIFIPTLEV